MKKSLADLLGKLGATIKFKPWQVTKMASFATKALPIIGVGIEIVTDIIAANKEQKRNRQFQNTKDDLKDEIRQLFREVRNGLEDDEKYFAEFVPDYGMLQDLIRDDEAAICAQEQLLRSFKAWEKKITESDLTFC